MPRRRWLVTAVAVVVAGGAVACARRSDARPMAAPGLDRPPPAREVSAAEHGPRVIAMRPTPLPLPPRPGRTEAEADGVPISLAEPGDDLLAEIARSRLGPAAAEERVQTVAAAVLARWRRTNRHGPDPTAYAALLEREAALLDAGGRAWDAPSGGVGAADAAASGARGGEPARTAESAGTVEGPLRLLVIAVEFAGADTVRHFSHPRSMTDRTCVTETLTLRGPLSGEIPPPGPRDNNTLWLPAFDAHYYDRILFHPDGYLGRVRPDLVDPEDGAPGMDISGRSVSAYFHQASGGRVRVEAGPAGVLAWVQVPHSQAYYGASECRDGRAPDIADMRGLPANPRYGFGPRQLVVDAVEAVNAAHPGFPWAAYDTDGDGVVEHLVVIHAGKDKSNGGGVQGWQAVWAHRDVVDAGRGGYVVDDRGTPLDPTDDIRVLGYTMQHEDLDPGVVVHELGHALGLPDLIDGTRAGSASAEAWDVMGAASRFGKLNGTQPALPGAWSRWMLGWLEPLVVTATAQALEVTLGQASGAPGGTVGAVRLDLPATPVTHTVLGPGSSEAWWSGDERAWSDARLWRRLELPAGGTVTLQFDLALGAEPHRQFLFVEVSDDGGATFVQTRGRDAADGTELTTPEDYADPSGRLRPGVFGPLRHGYTGAWSGWRRVTHDLSAHAGREVMVRFRYLGDERGASRGVHVDNVDVRAGDRVVFADPVEGGRRDGWRAEVESLRAGVPVALGWRLTTGVKRAPRYYLLEWRSANGFDGGLGRGYHTVRAGLTAEGASERWVDPVAANVPGLVVWLRDTRFGTDNAVLADAHLQAEQSEGPKGGLLVVDSHPQPLRGPRGGTVRPVDPVSGVALGAFPYPPADNWPGRVQGANAAFGLHATPALTLTVAGGVGAAAAHGANQAAAPSVTRTHHAPLPARPGFHDAFGYTAGVELLPVPVPVAAAGGHELRIGYAFSDPTAGVVTPAGGYYAPRTPAGFPGMGEGPAGGPDAEGAGEALYTVGGELRRLRLGAAGGTAVRGARSGHPGSDGVHVGVHARVVRAAADGSHGVVRVWRSRHELELDADIVAVDAGAGVETGAPAARVLGVHAVVRNVGGRTTTGLYSHFGEPGRLVPGSVWAGGVPVAADLATVRRAVLVGGAAGLAALAVAEGLAFAVAWASDDLDTGAWLAAGYALGPPAAAAVWQQAFTAEHRQERLLLHGGRAWLPLVWSGDGP